MEGLTWELCASHHLVRGTAGMAEQQGERRASSQSSQPSAARAVSLSPAHLAPNAQERGWSGVELMNGVRDCWVKDIELINPDNGVMASEFAAWPAPACRAMPSMLPAHRRCADVRLPTLRICVLATDFWPIPLAASQQP